MAGTTMKFRRRPARRWCWAAALLLPGVAAAQVAPGLPELPPPPPVESAVPVVPAPAPVSPGPSDGTFDLRVKALEEKVYGLKERVYRSKAQLLLLDDKVAGGDLRHGTRAAIVHRNDMRGSFYLESLTYLLDGEPIFTRTDTRGELAEAAEVEVFRGRMVPGRHVIAVEASYHGRPFGPFTYLEGFKYRVRSSYELGFEGGKSTTVTVVNHEKGFFLTPREKRPAVRFDVEVVDETAEQAEPAKQTDGKAEAAR